VIVLDRLQKGDGAADNLPRDVSPARVAEVVRRRIEPEG
jgi:hypothetical protein